MIKLTRTNYGYRYETESHRFFITRTEKQNYPTLRWTIEVFSFEVGTKTPVRYHYVDTINEVKELIEKEY